MERAQSSLSIGAITPLTWRGQDGKVHRRVTFELRGVLVMPLRRGAQLRHRPAGSHPPGRGCVTPTPTAPTTTAVYRPAAARPAGCAPHVGLLVETLIAGLVDEFEGQRRYPALVQGGSAHFDRARTDRRRLVSGCREVHTKRQLENGADLGVGVEGAVVGRGRRRNPVRRRRGARTAACAEPHRH